MRALRASFYNLISKLFPNFLLSKKLRLTKAKLNNDYLTFQKDIWGRAFIEYASGSGKPIPLLWVDGPYPGNFGDWLSPYILRKISKTKIIHVPDYAYSSEKHIVGLGSIAAKINQYSHVFGSGIHLIDHYVSPKAFYHFVRGPYTRKRVIACGGPRVDVLGDMGFILRKIYKMDKPSIIQNKILLVRHVIHQNLPLILSDDITEYSINASGSESIEALINQILNSNMVITSALHCYIACKSYDVPCVLVDFLDSKYDHFGDGIKYQDAVEGAGLGKVNIIQLGLDLSKINFENLVNEVKLSEKYIDDLYEHIKKSISIFNRS